MKLTDGKRTVEIEMRIWDDKFCRLGPDFSDDYFQDCRRLYDDEADAYIVDDVDYCIDYANDWKHGVGDFYDESNFEDLTEEEIENNVVIVTEL